MAVNKDLLKKEEIIPDVLDDFEPKIALNVKYGDLEITPNKIATPTQVKDRPTVSYDAEEGYHYTLVMTDPDAPSRKDAKFREWVHWVVVNIPGNDVSKGEEWKHYVGSGPPKGTGLHRYVFILYKHKDKIDFSAEPKLGFSGDQRGGWKVREFAKKFNLGQPIAVNWYQAEWDDYVPKLYKALGDE